MVPSLENFRDSKRKNLCHNLQNYSPLVNLPFSTVFSSVVDPNTLKWNPDPEYWPHLDPDPELC